MIIAPPIPSIPAMKPVIMPITISMSKTEVDIFK
jgi:hypothetical protein